MQSLDTGCGITETDSCLMSQHSTIASDLSSVPVAEWEASVFFAKALRFPDGLLDSIIRCHSVRMILTPYLDK
jgi:hypothetical protein